MGNRSTKLTLPNEGERLHYCVIHDFVAVEENEIDLYKNETIIAVEDTTSVFWIGEVTRNNKTFVGKFHKSHVCPFNDLRRFDWYFDIERAEAMNLLLNVAEVDCSFLVRKTKKQSHCYTLCIKVDKDQKSVVHNIRIYEINNKVTLGHHDDPVFRSLKCLVDHYKQNPIGRNILLTTPCPKNQPVYEDISSLYTGCIFLDYRHIEKKEILGEGEFGVVWLGMYKKKRKVALKILNSSEDCTRMLESFVKEARLWRQISHPNIVPFYGICNECDHHYIVTEYLKNGSLEDYLKVNHRNEDILTDYCKLYFSLQIAQGMEYLSEKMYIHRDLAARNILVSENLSCKIGDFGLAVITTEYYVSSNKSRIPYKWQPLEVLQRSIYTPKSDVWSYGVVLYEIFTNGGIPYCHLSNKDDIEEELLKGMYLQVDEKFECPSVIQDLMSECFSQPNARPEFTIIVDRISVALKSLDFNQYLLDSEI